jgi:hypothetical protein
MDQGCEGGKLHGGATAVEASEQYWFKNGWTRASSRLPSTAIEIPYKSFKKGDYTSVA